MSPMGAQEMNKRSRNIPGCPGTQADTRRILADVGAGHFGEHPIWPFFLPFLPSSNPCGATMKTRKIQSSSSECHSIFKGSTWNFTEVEKEHSTSRSGSVERSHFFGLVNCMIFGALGAYPTHVCKSPTKSGKSLSSLLDTPVLTASKNKESTLWEEPPKIVTFNENPGRSCNIDDPD